MNDVCSIFPGRKGPDLAGMCQRFAARLPALAALAAMATAGTLRAQNAGGEGSAPASTSATALNGPDNVANAANAPANNAGVPAPQFWLGVAVENIPPSFAKQLRLKPQQGLMVVGIIPGTPAQRADLRPEDLLIEINGEPLLSQEQLARGVNRVAPADKAAAPGIASCDITYLREGVRSSARLTPELRPTNMVVTGMNLGSFSAGVPASAARGPDMRNYVLSNGRGVQVGPGYTFDLNNSGTSESVIRAAVQNGQTVVMSQERDASGNVTNSISADGATYFVPGDMEKMPQSLQPLAREIQSNTFRQQASNSNNNNALTFSNASDNSNKDATHAAAPANLERQFQDQQKMIEQLMEQNKQLQDQIQKLTQTINDRLPTK